MKTVEELILFAHKILDATSSTARLDAELLFAWLTGISRESLVLRRADTVDVSLERRYCELIERRKLHEPVAYLTGQKEFWSLEFEVNKNVLVPRPETELLVEQTLSRINASGDAVGILDLGTGSGCIAIALAHELKKKARRFKILAVDSSVDALLVAERNAARHNVKDCIEFLCSDWFYAIDEKQRFDLILSNPPYVDILDHNYSPELAFEPKTALFADDGGFAVIRRLISEAPARLITNGWFLCEIGASQGARSLETVKKYCCRYDYLAELLQDLAGQNRALALQIRGQNE